MNKRFVVIDLETTGNSPRNGDRIIQIGVVVVENDQIIERYSSFVNPERDIPPFITQLTGINESMVKGAPTFAELVPKVVGLLQNAYFVAHNVSFDLGFLQEELKRAGRTLLHIPKIDTVELSRILIPTVGSYKLSELAQILSLQHDNPHQADSDAEVTAKILITMLKKLHSLTIFTLQQIRRHSKRLYSDLQHLLDNFIEEKLLSLKEVTGEPDYEVYQGLAIKKRKSHLRKEERNREDELSFEQFIANIHSLPIDDYEYRPGQWSMMRDVYRAFEASEHALIEAGTGIGKSLAYLIPSLYYSLQKNKRVVISTYTLQLQQQLMERDIPILQKMIQRPFSVAVLKGKRNYISVRKFARFLETEDKNYDQVLTKCQILVWLTETETGDVDELNLSSGGRLIWSSIQMDYSGVEEGKDVLQIDFFQRAKEWAAQAEIIVTNHAFLLQDLKGNGSLLPPYEHLLIDEAHQLEDVAAQYLGEQVGYISIRQLLNRIGKSHEDGCLGWIRAVCEKLDFNMDDDFREMDYRMDELLFEFDELFRLIRSYMIKKQAHKQADTLRYRIYPLTEKGYGWSAIQELLHRIIQHSRQFIARTTEWEMLLTQHRAELERLSLEFVFDYFTDVALFRANVESLQNMLQGEETNIVRWVEADIKAAANATVISSQPLQLGDLFADYLFAKKKSVVLTSATLTVNGTFAYMISRLGLSDFSPRCVSIPSPFNYQEQAKMLVPIDLPSVSAAPLEEYAKAVADSILRIAERLKGKMLVLFTSYEMLRLTASFAKDMNIEEKFVLIAQGVSSGSAAKLSKSFRQFNHAILFGTSSFWEGVDFPGDELSCVVIVRLPFAPPDDPAVEAKCETIRLQGGNPFYDYSLPQAVIRFKQGIGRLIRSSKDKGIVFVFDKRIIYSTYGKYFLSSIPPISVDEGTLDVLLSKVDNWLLADEH